MDLLHGSTICYCHSKYCSNVLFLIDNLKLCVYWVYNSCGDFLVEGHIILILIPHLILNRVWVLFHILLRLAYFKDDISNISCQTLLITFEKSDFLFLPCMPPCNLFWICLRKSEAYLNNWRSENALPVVSLKTHSFQPFLQCALSIKTVLDDTSVSVKQFHIKILSKCIDLIFKGKMSGFAASVWSPIAELPLPQSPRDFNNNSACIVKVGPCRSNHQNRASLPPKNICRSILVA